LSDDIRAWEPRMKKKSRVSFDSPSSPSLLQLATHLAARTAKLSAGPYSEVRFYETATQHKLVSRTPLSSRRSRSLLALSHSPVFQHSSQQVRNQSNLLPLDHVVSRTRTQPRASSGRDLSGRRLRPSSSSWRWKIGRGCCWLSEREPKTRDGRGSLDRWKKRGERKEERERKLTSFVYESILENPPGLLGCCCCCPPPAFPFTPPPAPIFSPPCPTPPP